MSRLSEWLKKVGVPQEGLDAIQGMLDGLTGEAKKRVNEIIAKVKSELGAVLPTAEALATSIKRQPKFKSVYRALPAEQRAGIDAALNVICEAALVKVRKALGV